MPFLCLLISLLAASSLFADNKAQPVIAPVPAPAFMDVVTFEFNAEGEKEKVVVTSTTARQRIDVPDDGYSVIYNPQTQFYTGLEHRNYTYWEFAWPEVRAAVQNSKRYEKHLQDLGNEGMSPDTVSPSTNAPSSSSASSSLGGDSSGYVWHPTLVKQRISDLDCVQWLGETESGQDIKAWCYPGLLPKLQAAVEILRTVNEPMALVPVRTVVPDTIFPVYDALVKGGVTPVLITWGDEHNLNHFRFIEARTRDGQLKLFTVPKLYVKTTLVTMDGMIDSQPAPDLRGRANPPRVDHSDMNPVPKPGQGLGQ